MKKVRPRPTTAWGKVWYFIWHEDSAASWVVNVVLAFLLIKFVVYPGLGALFGTRFPIVAVVSGSMEHPGGFDAWWQSPAHCGRLCSQEEWYALRNITRTGFAEYPFANGFSTGDIIVLFGARPERIEVGDVIVYRSGKPYPIIHRVVSVHAEDGTYFQTKGDHNRDQINSAFERLNEYHVPAADLLGRAVFRIPFLGYIKIWFVDYIWGPIKGFFS